MTLEAPNLDSRTFDSLMAEARQRIVRWAPEWTDHNASDPGITLVELFAWLTETMLYELNRVPDLTYLKFLELLGIRPDPAAAAAVDVTFTAREGVTAPPVVPVGTQVAGPGASGQPAVFETGEELALIPYRLADLRVDDGASFTQIPVDPTGPGTPFRPFGWVTRPGNALYLGFQPPATAAPGTTGPAGAFPAEMRFLASQPPARAAAHAVRADVAVAPPVPPVTLAWEYLPEQGLSWRPLQQFADGSVAFTRDGYIRVAGPAGITPAGDVAGQHEPRYWLRIRVVNGHYPAGGEAELQALTPNTVAAQNLVTVTDELIGVAEGHPDESFDLEHKPVVAETVQIEVRTDVTAGGLAGPAAASVAAPPVPGEPESPVWKQVPDFLSALPEDPVYAVDPDAGVVTFGNGVRGRIPPAGADVVATSYRYGGGPDGNLPAGAVTELRTAVPGVDSVVNRRPAAGGSVRQPLDEVKRSAPALLRRQQRAVTADDYASLAREAGGVADAKALQRWHPDHPDADVPGVISVVVVSDSGDDEPAPPAEVLAGVARDLNQARLLTTELYVVPPVFRVVTVTAELIIQPYAAPGEVVRKAKQALTSFLAPVQVDDQGSASASFGRSLYPTELYRLLLQQDVVQVSRLEVSVGGEPYPDLTKPIPLPPNGLLRSGDHQLTVKPLDTGAGA